MVGFQQALVGDCPLVPVVASLQVPVVGFQQAPAVVSPQVLEAGYLPAPVVASLQVLVVDYPPAQAADSLQVLAILGDAYLHNRQTRGRVF